MILMNIYIYTITPKNGGSVPPHPPNDDFILVYRGLPKY